jgi:hypothetical protein
MIFNYKIIEEEMYRFGETKEKLLSIKSKKGSVYFDYIHEKSIVI